jgi:hypothetical protein
MGRTIPSFRLALADEESEWKAFRNSLDKFDKKLFDDMFAIPRLYISACSCAVKPVRVQPVFMSIIFHHLLQLLEISEKLGVEELEPIPG